MEFHQQFTNIDWMVVAGYLLLTTWVGHLLKGSSINHQRFFSRRKIPALAGSIWINYRDRDQWSDLHRCPWDDLCKLVVTSPTCNGALVRIIARIIVGIYFVRVFYQREIYSPYDYMGNQLGEGAKRLATIIFQVGGILGQA